MNARPSHADSSLDSTRLEILFKVLQAANASLNAEQVCAQVVHALAELGGYAILSISLKHGDRFETAAQVGWPEGAAADLTKGVHGRVLRSGAPQFVPDVHADPDYISIREDIASEICVPIKVGHEMVGLLNIETTVDRPLTEQDFRLAIALADQIGQVLRNANLYQNQLVMLQALLQVTPDVIIFKDRRHRLLACSQAKCEHHGLKMQEMIGLTDYDLFPPEQAEYFEAEEDEVMRTGQPLVAEHLLDLPGGQRWYEAIKTPLRDAQGNIIGILCTERDITERKQAEAALQEAQRTLSTLMSNLPGMVYRCRNDKDWTMEFVSEGCRSLTGYQPDDLIHNSRVTYAELIHPADRQMVWDTVQQGVVAHRPFQMTYRIVATSGEEKWVWEQGQPIFSPAGKLLFLEGFITDVTPQKKTEEALRLSLWEKQMLLQEVHHRVGNNLQVIASLLSLQADHLEDPQVAQMFRESRERIRSMALIHERLYRSRDLSRISPAEYLESLVCHLFNIYGAEARDIQYELIVEEVPMDLNTAIPVGMIVNELVSNALEHAFVDNRVGTITISLMKKERDQVRLTVGDNGIGFPKHLDIHETTSMGLQLVVLLVQQIQGTIALYRTDGTIFEITFPQTVT